MILLVGRPQEVARSLLEDVMTVKYDRDWVHPFCTVRLIPGTKLVQDYVEKKRELWEYIRDVKHDLTDLPLKRLLLPQGIKLEYLQEEPELVSEDQTAEDLCWVAKRTGFVRNRRWVAEELGLFPAFTDNKTPDYDFDLSAEMDGKLWTACRWGTKGCCRPSHLVVGTFAGLTPDKRLALEDRRLLS